jgi:hypothetical protein
MCLLWCVSQKFLVTAQSSNWPWCSCAILGSRKLIDFFFFFWWGVVVVGEHNTSNSAVSHLIVEVSRSHTIGHTHPVGLLCLSHKFATEVAIYTTHNRHKRWTSMPWARFELTILAVEQLQTYAWDHTATGISLLWISVVVSLQINVASLCCKCFKRVCVVGILWSLLPSEMEILKAWRSGIKVLF